MTTTVTLFEVIDTDDGEVLRACYSREQAETWLESERETSSLTMAVRERTLTDVEPKHAALARFLNESPESLEESRYDSDVLTCNGIQGEYRVLTDSEADAATDESLESYIDDALFSGIADSHPLATLKQYFNRESWKRDVVLSDGRGPPLSSYDGAEQEEQIDGVWYFIYRVN